MIIVKEKSMKRVLCRPVRSLLLPPRLIAQPPGGRRSRRHRRGHPARLHDIKMNLTQTAEKMPDADYGFKPATQTSAATASCSRTSRSAVRQCAAAKGVPNPIMGSELETELKTKAEIVKALARFVRLLRRCVLGADRCRTRPR